MFFKQSTGNLWQFLKHEQNTSSLVCSYFPLSVVFSHLRLKWGRVFLPVAVFPSLSIPPQLLSFPVSFLPTGITILYPMGDGSQPQKFLRTSSQGRSPSPPVCIFSCPLPWKSGWCLLSFQRSLSFISLTRTRPSKFPTERLLFFVQKPLSFPASWLSLCQGAYRR